MAIRDHALANEAEVFRVLESSVDAEQRAMAASALGYVRASSRQVAGLARASLDADDNVRNNAVRALGVLIAAKPEFALEVPSSSFIQLLTSPTWSDHNKGAMLLEALTRNRDAELLRRLRAAALDNLLEMARWRSNGHAFTARTLLGRIAGIEEGRLQKLASSGDGDAIIRALPPER
jgi:HEAT repeat protein